MLPTLGPQADGDDVHDQDDHEHHQHVDTHHEDDQAHHPEGQESHDDYDDRPYVPSAPSSPREYNTATVCVIDDKFVFDHVFWRFYSELNCYYKHFTMGDAYIYSN